MVFDPTPASERPDAAPIFPEGTGHARSCRNTMLSETQKAVQLTLDDLAALARLATAAPDEYCSSHPEAAGRSAYSLLLEPALFRFPA